MKKYLKVFWIMVFFIFILSVGVNAADTIITKDELKQKLDNIILLSKAESANSLFANYSDVKVYDDKITLKNSNTEYTILYSISNNKINFSCSFDVEKGMNYNEYNEKICGDYKVIPSLLYSAVAEKYDCVYKEATGYYNLILLNNILNGASTSTKYTIVDSRAEATESDENVILTSEFGDKVLEVVDNQFKERYSFSDSNILNSFVCNMTKQNLTQNSRRLSFDLTVDTTADFSDVLIKELEIFNSQEAAAKEKSRYKVKLKVGQKLVAPWAKGIIVYGNYVKLDGDGRSLELEGIKEGTTHGIIYTRTGGDESIYIEVEKNTESKPQDDYVLEHKENDNEPEKNNNDKPVVDTKTEEPSKPVEQPKETPHVDDEDKPIKVIRVGFDEDNNSNTVTTPTQSEDTTTAKTVLPKTGASVGIVISIILIILVGYNSYKKYKDLKDIK